jgi:hypothetical protein
VVIYPGGFCCSASVQGRVTFYQNLELLGDTAMPRRLTDCFNGLEGVLLGDAGLQLGQALPRLLCLTDKSIVLAGMAYNPVCFLV